MVRWRQSGPDSERRTDLHVSDDANAVLAASNITQDGDDARRLRPTGDNVQLSGCAAPGNLLRDVMLSAVSRTQAMAPRAVRVERLVAALNDMLLGSLGEANLTQTTIGDRIWNVPIDPAQQDQFLPGPQSDASAAPDEPGADRHRFAIDAGIAGLRTMRTGEMDTMISDVSVLAGTETILVVENDDGAGDRVVAMLAGLGYRVLKAKSMAGALSMIQSGVTVDLLFTGIIMPGWLRAELAQKLGRVLPAHAAADRDAPGSTTGLRLLLVEDDLLIRDNSAELLSEHGHAVTQAASAELALELLEQAPIDVLITDLRLPGINGTELARLALGCRPNMGVVFATGDDTVEIPASGPLAGAVLLRKPYDRRSLLAAIATASAICRSMP